MPKVSVIVPNYNHAPYLRQRIESVLNQTYQDFELILLDDCSTDISREVLSEYINHPKVSHCVLNEQNSGSTFRQWEKGVHLAKGEYIWIAESDDWAEPELLETLCGLLDNQPKVGLAYCNTAIYRDGKCIGNFASEKKNKFSLSRWDIDYCISGNKEIEEALLWDCTINNASAVLMRKKIFRTILPDLNQFRYSGDWFCYLQFAAVSDIAYSHKMLNNYREHGTNVSKNAGYDYLVELFLIYSWLMKAKVIADKSLLIKAFHAYVSDVYSTGLSWSMSRDFRVLRPLNLTLYINLTTKLLKRKVRRFLQSH